MSKYLPLKSYLLIKSIAAEHLTVHNKYVLGIRPIYTITYAA